MTIDEFAKVACEVGLTTRDGRRYKPALDDFSLTVTIDCETAPYWVAAYTRSTNGGQRRIAFVSLDSMSADDLRKLVTLPNERLIPNGHSRAIWEMVGQT